MPFEIVRNDIVNMQVDAVVNPTNSRPWVGGGTDTGIHRKAGPQLLAARRRLGWIPVGRAAVTPGFGLNARWVIHTVGPVWRDGSRGETALLRRCYENALELARKQSCSSVAFPLLCAGNRGFPAAVALHTAVEVISAFLLRHELQVYLVVFDKTACELTEKLFPAVKSYIDERYVAKRMAQEADPAERERRRRWDEERLAEESLFAGEEAPFGECVGEEAFDVKDRPFREVIGEGLPTAAAPESAAIPDGAARLHPRRDTAQREAFAPAARPAGAAAKNAEPQRSAAPAAAAMRKAAPAVLGCAPLPGAEDAAGPDWEALLQKVDADFSQTLLRMIDASGKTDPEVYKKANVDRKLFSKIRNNPEYRPSKPTALAFAMALELDLEATRELIGRAGYALTHSSRFDIIVEYFILHGDYDVFRLNEVLFAFDQPLLGA